MIIEASQYKCFIRSLRGIYRDSWRYTFRVFKWMVRYAVCYLDAKDLLWKYEHSFPLDRNGKNVLAREIVEVNELNNCEFLVDRFTVPEKLLFKEDIGLMMCKTLVRRGYGFYKDTLFYTEDSVLTCVRSNEKYYLDNLLNVFFRPKTTCLMKDVLEMMFTLDSDFCQDNVEDYMKYGPVDKTLGSRCAKILYESKRKLFRLNDGRDYEKVLYYDDDYRCLPYNEVDNFRLNQIMSSAQEFENKYLKLCKLFKVTDFKTGDLLGSGTITIFGSNDFYRRLFLYGTKLERALIEYIIICDTKAVEFDPFGLFFQYQAKLVGEMEIHVNPIINVAAIVHNNDLLDNRVVMVDGAGVIYNLDFRRGEYSSTWTIKDCSLCCSQAVAGEVKVAIQFRSTRPVRMTVRFESRQWRGGAADSLVKELEVKHPNI